jgi:hypothetical protein
MKTEEQNSVCLKSRATARELTKAPDLEVPDEGMIKGHSPEPFVDADEAGNFLQLQRRRVLQLARQGKLPAYPIGEGLRRIWRFRLSELATAMLHSRQRSHVPEEI